MPRLVQQRVEADRPDREHADDRDDRPEDAPEVAHDRSVSCPRRTRRASADQHPADLERLARGTRTSRTSASPTRVHDHVRALDHESRRARSRASSSRGQHVAAVRQELSTRSPTPGRSTRVRHPGPARAGERLARVALGHRDPLHQRRVVLEPEVAQKRRVRVLQARLLEALEELRRRRGSCVVWSARQSASAS